MRNLMLAFALALAALAPGAALAATPKHRHAHLAHARRHAVHPQRKRPAPAASTHVDTSGEDDPETVERAPTREHPGRARGGHGHVSQIFGTPHGIPAVGKDKE